MADKRGTKRAASLLRDLADALRGSVTAGAEWRGQIIEDGLVAEIQVRVRRAVTTDDERRHREGAIETLRRETWRVHHCGCRVTRRGWIRRLQGDCSGRIVAAVAYRPYLSQGADLYQFVCSRHLDAHGIDGGRVLAVVRLADRKAWEAKCRAEEEALREREARRPC